MRMGHIIRGNSRFYYIHREIIYNDEKVKIYFKHNEIENEFYTRTGSSVGLKVAERRHNNQESETVLSTRLL